MTSPHHRSREWLPKEDLGTVVRGLSAVAAPAGHEDRMTHAVCEFLDARGLTFEVDSLGQVLTTFGPQSAPRSVMVSAHLDELGLVVRGIDDDGWLRVHRLGGMPERILPALRLVAHTRSGDIDAVVGTKSHHLTEVDEKYVARPATELYLDAGFASAQEASDSGVRVGDPVTYAPTWSQRGTRVSGKSLDDRVGVAALLRLVDDLRADPPDVQVHVAFSCQEEFNLLGTLALAERCRPDIAVVVDITPATDTPDLRGHGRVRLGAGPVLSRLTFHGRGTLGGLIPHPALVRAVEESADSADIDLQRDAVVGVVTDAAYLSTSTAEGVATVGIGIPCRYTHAPTETVDLSDVTSTADLLAAFVRERSQVSLVRGTEWVESENR